jgi:hypothetical protein
VTYVAAEGLRPRERYLALVSGEFHSELLGAAPAAREVFMLPVTIDNKIRLRVPEAIDARSSGLPSVIRTACHRRSIDRRTVAATALIDPLSTSPYSPAQQ